MVTIFEYELVKDSKGSKDARKSETVKRNRRVRRARVRWSRREKGRKGLTDRCKTVTVNRWKRDEAITNSACQTAWATHCFQTRPKSAARNVTSARDPSSPCLLFSNPPLPLLSTLKASYLLPPLSSTLSFFRFRKN